MIKMYKAMDFKGILSDEEMKEIGDFKGKKVELLIRELPDNSNRGVKKVVDCTNMSPEEIVKLIRNDMQNHMGGAKG